MLGTVKASDADGDTVTYAFAEGSNADGYFAIDSTSGEITLTAAGAASLANDFEELGNTQTVTVVADDGTKTTSITVKLNETNLNDNAPAFTDTTTENGTAIYSFDYAENATTSTVLGTVKASDADGDKVTYACSSSAPMAQI